MEEHQLQGAIEILNLFGVEPPYSFEECQKILQAHVFWWKSNSVTSLSDAIKQASQSQSSYYNAMQQAVDEVRNNRQ